MCAHSSLEVLTLCLTSSWVMKFCQSECQVSLVINMRTNDRGIMSPHRQLTCGCEASECFTADGVLRSARTHTLNVFCETYSTDPCEFF